MGEPLTAFGQQRLEEIRAVLEHKLAALESALANPDGGESLEQLVLDLARTATEEAQTALEQAVADANDAAEARIAAARTDAEAAGEQDRASVLELQRALEEARQKIISVDADWREYVENIDRQLKEELAHQSEAADAAQRAIDDLERQLAAERASITAERASITAERASAAADRASIAELRAAVDAGQAKAAELASALDGKAAEIAHLQKSIDGERASRAKLQKRADDEHAAADEAKRALDAERQGQQQLQKTVEAERASRAKLEKELEAARATSAKQLEDLEAVHASVAELRGALDAAEHAKGRAAGKDAAELERERTKAVDLEQRLDEVKKELRAERGVAQQLRAGVEEADKRRERAESIRVQAEADIESLRRENDAVRKQLDAARAELERARGEMDRARSEIDLQQAFGETPQSSPAAPASRPQAAASGGKSWPVQRGANRYHFGAGTDVQIDGEPGVLVDLSLTGCQVIASGTLKPNRVVKLGLPTGGDKPLACTGKVVWARLEPPSTGGGLRYRAGVHFTKADRAELEALIARIASQT